MSPQATSLKEESGVSPIVLGLSETVDVPKGCCLSGWSRILTTTFSGQGFTTCTEEAQKGLPGD